MDIILVNDYFHSQCPACGALGPATVQHEDALDAWNCQPVNHMVFELVDLAMREAIRRHKHEMDCDRARCVFEAMGLEAVMSSM